MDLFPRASISTVDIVFTLSIRVTAAPKSARSIPQNGAGASPAISMTRTPDRAAILKTAQNSRFTGWGRGDWGEEKENTFPYKVDALRPKCGCVFFNGFGLIFDYFD